MYELRDTTVTSDLVAQEKAGVKVRVILDGKETSVNGAAFSALQAGGVAVQYSSSAYVYAPEDDHRGRCRRSYISTGNLDTTYYATSRDYGVFDTDPADVGAVVAVFNADFAKTAITPVERHRPGVVTDRLTVRLLALVSGAQHSLDVEQEEFSDTTLVNAVFSPMRSAGWRYAWSRRTRATRTRRANEVTAGAGR